MIKLANILNKWCLIDILHWSTAETQNMVENNQNVFSWVNQIHSEDFSVAFWEMKCSSTDYGP